MPLKLDVMKLPALARENIRLITPATFGFKGPGRCKQKRAPGALE